MEYIDKMKKFRMQSALSILIFVILAIVLTISLLINKLGPELLFYPNLILLTILYTFILFVILVEIYRPNFIVTENEIIFSHVPILSLLKKERFINSYKYEDINEILVGSDSLEFKIKDRMRYLSLDKSKLDNPSIIFKWILKNAKNKGIIIKTYSRTRNQL